VATSLERLGKCDYFRVHAANTKPVYVKLVKGRRIKRVSRKTVPRRCLRKNSQANPKLAPRQEQWIARASDSILTKTAVDLKNHKAFVVNWENPGARKKKTARLSVLDLRTGQVKRDILELGDRAAELLILDETTGTLIFWNGLTRDPLILLDPETNKVTGRVKLSGGVTNFAPLSQFVTCGEDKLALLGSSVISLKQQKQVAVVKDLVPISATAYDARSCTLYFNHHDLARQKQGLHMTLIRAVNLKTGEVQGTADLGKVGHRNPKPPIMSVVKDLFLAGGALIALAGDGSIYPGHSHEHGRGAR
jgi:hypothetical protein